MTKSITTKGGTTTAKTGEKKKKQNYLRKCIRRKNCIFCLIFNIVFALAIVIAITFISFKYTHIRGYIADAEKRKQQLMNRMDIDAYFHQGECQIYSKDDKRNQLANSDHTFCNRYCEGNYHMEFLYRSVLFDQELQKVSENAANICPHYVEIRPCRNRMAGANANSKSSKCLEKKFVHDYIYNKVPNSPEDPPYMGICIACAPPALNL